MGGPQSDPLMGPLDLLATPLTWNLLQELKSLTKFESMMMRRVFVGLIWSPPFLLSAGKEFSAVACVTHRSSLFLEFVMAATFPSIDLHRHRPWDWGTFYFFFFKFCRYIWNLYCRSHCSLCHVVLLLTRLEMTEIVFFHSFSFSCNLFLFIRGFFRMPFNILYCAFCFVIALGQSVRTCMSLKMYVGVIAYECVIFYFIFMIILCLYRFCWFRN